MNELTINELDAIAVETTVPWRGEHKRLLMGSTMRAIAAAIPSLWRVAHCLPLQGDGFGQPAALSKASARCLNDNWLNAAEIIQWRFFICTHFQEEWVHSETG